MSNTVTLGGDRLGAGGKQEVTLSGYGRSTQNMDYTWRSSMASGTLVPFLTEVGLPGDSFSINLSCDAKTLPTIGPLFGSYKVQIDVFKVPVRLYNGKLHMNMLGLGMKMDTVKLPQIEMQAKSGEQGDNSQINASSIWSHLNIRGLGRSVLGEANTVKRNFNAVPYLAYWDIYKNYYANKQEEIGMVIHNTMNLLNNNILTLRLTDGTTTKTLTNVPTSTPFKLTSEGRIIITFTDDTEEVDPRRVLLRVRNANGTEQTGQITEIFQEIIWSEDAPGVWSMKGKNPRDVWANQIINWLSWEFVAQGNNIGIPKLTQFSLENIDKMRMNILSAVNNSYAYIIDKNSEAPYGLSLIEGDIGYSKIATQEGLGIKTYQSDLFNNWVSTEWMDGDGGINEITAVDTSSGSFTIDALMLSRKVYDMFNRIAVSGGSYDDWLNAVYDHDRTRSVENPIYVGGLIKELAFQEVISNAATEAGNETQPLGTLAGRGILTNKNKGGSVEIKIDEPSYVMGIVSLTPRLDYSQGNKWDVNLKTMDDFHKPALDEIAFQDLTTDQMAWWDTLIDEDDNIMMKSAGKVPAWINYMTNVNVTRGNFAVNGKEMFMTLNRRYGESGNNGGITDLTTYIDPSKFNNIFADERLDAENFWMQIGVDMKVRRKMSAKIMPNL